MRTSMTGFAQFARDAGTLNLSQSEFPAGNTLPLIVVDAPQIALKQNVAKAARWPKPSAVPGEDAQADGGASKTAPKSARTDEGGKA